MEIGEERRRKRGGERRSRKVNNRGSCTKRTEGKKRTETSCGEVMIEGGEEGGGEEWREGETE